MEGDGMSLRHLFCKDLHRTACYISTYDALQSFLNNNDDNELLRLCRVSNAKQL